MSADRIIYAYLITNTVNGKQYVGITGRSVAKRWKEHLACAVVGVPHVLYNAIRKYGADKFTIQDIAEAYSPSEGGRLERALIAAYGTMAPTGYNMTSGGEVVAGTQYSRASKDKMAASAVHRFVKFPHLREVLRQARLGKPWSEESKKKASASHTGLKRSEEHKQRQREVMATEEYRANLRAGVARARAEGKMQKAPLTSEEKQEVSRKLKAYYADPAAREKRRKEMFAYNAKKKAEDLLALGMDDLLASLDVTRASEN